MNGFTSLIAIALDWSDDAMTLAIVAGACAGLLASVVLAIDIFFRRWLTSRQMGLLWGVVLLRLLVPLAPSSSLSLQNLFPSAPIETAEPRDLVHPDARSIDVAYSQPLAANSATSNSHVVTAPEAAPDAIDVSVAIDWFFTTLPLGWLIGTFACLIWTIRVHWLFCRVLKQVVTSEDPRLRRLWEVCRRQAGVRRQIPIVLFDGVQQPAVLGLFRPKLLLPADAAELNDQQLRMVMLHELAHVRRWDIAANWVLVVIRAIHWWNPVYWLAAVRFQSLREQSCDAFAIQRIEGQPTRSYGELLLTLAQRQPSGAPWRVVLPASILGFFSSFFRKRAVHNRLKALRFAGVKHSRWHTAGVAGLVGLMAVCGLTDASTPATSTVRSADWLPPSDSWYAWIGAPAIEPGPIVTRTYDVAKALARIAADELTEDDARVQLKWHLIHMLAGLEGRRYDHASENDRKWAQETLAFDGAGLTLTASLGMHAEIVRNLSAWEQSGLGQISVETRFITDERDIASAIGVSWRCLEAFSADRDEALPSESGPGMPVVRAEAAVDEYLPVSVATLDDQQALAFVRASQIEGRANDFQAPKVTLFSGQLASVVDRTQTPFVVGVRDVGEGVRQPKIAIVDEGTKLTLRAVLSGDSKKVQLEGRIEMSEICDVRTASTLLRGEPTTIQIPRVKRCRIDVSSEVQDGQSLLIGCIPAYEQKQFFYVLLTVRSLQLSSEAAN